MPAGGRSGRCDREVGESRNEPVTGSLWSVAEKGSRSGWPLTRRMCVSAECLLAQAALPAALTQDRVPPPAPRGLALGIRPGRPPGSPASEAERRRRQEA